EPRSCLSRGHGRELTDAVEQIPAAEAADVDKPQRMRRIPDVGWAEPGGIDGTRDDDYRRAARRDRRSRFDDRLRAVRQRDDARRAIVEPGLHRTCHAVRARSEL